MTIDRLLDLISVEYDRMGRQFKVIARRIERDREQLGILGIRDLASTCGVQPSTIVRFSKHFGLSGFSDLQRIFRDGLTQRFSGQNPSQAAMAKHLGRKRAPSSPDNTVREYLGNRAHVLQRLQVRLDAGALRRAVQLLAAADTVWVVGSHRSGPIVAYLEYAFRRTGKRVIPADTLRDEFDVIARSIKRSDVVVAASLRPYTDDVHRFCQEASRCGAKVIAITDSRLNKLSRNADTGLVVDDDGRVGHFPVSGVMAVAEGLIFAVANHKKLKATTGKRIGKG